MKWEKLTRIMWIEEINKADMMDKFVFGYCLLITEFCLAGPEPCCVKKKVGGVLYNLIHEEDTSAYDCHTNCVYQKDGESEQFCFSAGYLDSVCGK